MRKIFHQELGELGDDILAMARKVAEGVSGAGVALRDADIELAERVIDGDNRIDEYERTIESLALLLLARQAPVATDLRLVVSAMRLATTLERMGDLARHVASIVRSRYPRTVAHGEMFTLISEMTVAATEITGKLVELMENHDLELANAIESSDDLLDNALTRSFELIADESLDLSRQEIVDAVLLCRFLERIGDHSVSGAARVEYLVTGDLDASVTMAGAREETLE